MKLNLIIAICCLASFMLKAQDPTTFLDNNDKAVEKFSPKGPESSNKYFANSGFLKLKGKVVAFKSELAMPSASIAIKGKFNSTVTDEMGNFEINISQYINDTLVIMMMGYKKYEKSLREIEERGMRNFTLQEDSQVLDPVVVNVGYTGNEIIQRAIQNISKNYPNDPFVVEGLYRETIKEENKYVYLTEAVVSIYDEDYKAPLFRGHLQESVSLDEIRKSFLYNNKKYANTFDRDLVGMNWLEGLLKNNFVRYLKMPLTKDKVYKLDSISYLDNKRVYVVSAGTRATIWVDSENFAIVKMLWNNVLQTPPKDFNDSLAYVTTLVRYTYGFKEYNKLMYPHYFNHTIQEYDINIQSKKPVCSNEYFQELIITNIIENPSKKQYDFNSFSTKRVGDQAKAYNPFFWTNYKRTKDTMLDLKIVEDLGSVISLEEQFVKQK